MEGASIQIDTSSKEEKKCYKDLGEIDFYRNLVLQVVESVMKTNDELLYEAIPQTAAQLENKKLPLTSIEVAIQQANLSKHDHSHFPEINHLKVYQQQKSGLCGFYAYHNGKCFIRSILSKSQKEKVSHLVAMTDGAKFWSDYNRTVQILLNSTNYYYVNQQDKKSLLQLDCPLERNHLRYLLMKDSQALELFRNQSCLVLMAPFLYNFGLLQHSIEQIKELEEMTEAFLKSKKESVFCLFLGVVNHWVTFIAHKESPDLKIKLYFLDSTNQLFLNKSDEQLPILIEEKVQEKIQLKIYKKRNPFMEKMSLHSLFDLKKAFEIFLDVFSGKAKFSQYYTNGQIHNILKQFNSFTETFNPHGDQLEIPKSRMFGQVKALTLEEEKAKEKYDLGELQYPYKKVRGDYIFIHNLVSPDDLGTLVELIMNFLLSGSRPEHIEADVNRSLYAFGKKGFFQQDLKILSQWTAAIMEVHSKTQSQKKILQGFDQKNLYLWARFVKVAQELHAKIHSSKL